MQSGHRSLSRSVTLALLVALLPFTGAAAQNGPRIVVEGHGEISLAPDRAVIRIAIETRAALPEAAAATNGERTRSVLEALRAAGAADEELATLGYGVQPDWSWRDGERVLQGYVARTALRARTSALDRVGSWIDAAIGAGADQIEGISFELADPEGARRTALETAVRNARRDAEAMARAAGGELGSLIELSSVPEPTVGPLPTMRALEAAAPAPGTEVVVGQQSIRAAVRGTWAFVSGDS